MRRGRFYLGRIIKIGQLDQKQLIEAIIKPPIIVANRYSWTITDALESKINSVIYYYGKLSKFRAEGHIKVVDVENKAQQDAIEQNLLEASSPFVYLPEYSGIAYLHVWNGIQEDVFRRRFKNIIEKKYDNYFCECDIDVITDYRTFSNMIQSIDRFTEISANIVPPNPLYGICWEELKDYLKSRNAAEVQIKEVEQNNIGINTDIKLLISSIINDPEYKLTKPPAIGDAAILMAADGYGKGKVIGVREGKEIVIRTMDTQRSFLLNKEPEPDELAKHALDIFNDVSIERGMKH